ncbi:MAG: germination protein YpeB [Clostridiales bacterium]|nr:MAG: germination protein YpeB [Clostridiales bacterium]
MNIRISRRAFVRIITFITAAIVTLAALFYANYSENLQHKRAQEYTYLQSVEDLYTYLNSINSTLTKGVYCSSPQMLNTLASMLWRDAGFAKNSLALLPIDYFQLGGTYKFISQVGDYAVSLAKKVSNGESITEEEAQTLQTMREYCTDLIGSIYVLQEIVRQGNIDYNQANEEMSTTNAEDGQFNIGNGFKNFEESLGEFPSLIYDGPFSDHILQKDPLMLKGQAEITREQARDIAAKASGIPASELKDSGDEEGRMPSYCFETADQNVDIGVTKAGGFVTYCTFSAEVGEMAITPEEGIQIAKEYLQSHNITSVETSYYEISNNIMTINFAYTSNNITYYPDLIKVSVAMDDGEIISFHQRGYLANHQERAAQVPSITQEQAAKKLSPLLTVEQVKLAVIPTQGLNEVFCYEFKCTGQNGENILVYINAETGAEEQLLILLIGENGTLTA